MLPYPSKHRYLLFLNCGTNYNLVVNWLTDHQTRDFFSS